MRLTKQEFMEQEKVAIWTLDNWIYRHGLPVIQIGRRVYIDMDDFKKWLEDQKVSKTRPRVSIELPPPTPCRKNLGGKMRRIY